MNNIVDLRQKNNTDQPASPTGGREIGATVNNVVDLRYAKSAPSSRQVGISAMRTRTCESVYAKSANLKEKNAQEERQEEEACLTADDVLEHINPPVNSSRRKLLNFILIGMGAFVLGLLTKALGFPEALFRPKSNQAEIVLAGPSSKTQSNSQDSQQETDLKDWKIIENNNQVTFIDKKTNEEVLILD